MTAKFFPDGLKALATVDAPDSSAITIPAGSTGRHPNLQIASTATYTLSADSKLIVDDSLTVLGNGVLAVNGNSVVSITDTAASSALASSNSQGLVSAAAQTFGGVKTFSSGAAIKGVTGISAAAPGDIGEEKTSNISVFVAHSGSGLTKNITSLTLTPGEWAVTASVTILGNSMTGASAGMLVARNTGGGGTASGRDEVGANIPTSGTNFQATTAISTLTVRCDGTNTTVNGADSFASTTIYLNLDATYTAGPPNLRGTLSARRVR